MATCTVSYPFTKFATGVGIRLLGSYPVYIIRQDEYAVSPPISGTSMQHLHANSCAMTVISAAIYYKVAI